MKAYVRSTGTLFGLIVAAHLWRALVAEPHLVKDPFYIAITLAAAALTLWAWRLLRPAAR